MNHSFHKNSLFLILLILFLFPSCFRMHWGHHFSFKNELGFPIDSIRCTIGDEVNWVYPYEEENTLEANMQVPKKGYPHVVELQIFRRGSTIILPADSFDCYNCDGDHGYILRKTGAEYRFYN